MTRPRPWTVADREVAAAHVSAALATGDAGRAVEALGVAARSRGMDVVARRTKLSREQLQNVFSGAGYPALSTVLAVCRALGLELRAQRRLPAATAPDQGEDDDE